MKPSVSSPKTDEKDRSLATGFNCRQKSLCDANAACTADPKDQKRYTCVCNNGFEGNGSVCQGRRAFLTDNIMYNASIFITFVSLK